MNNNPFERIAGDFDAPQSTGRRIAGQFIKGATLGFAGSKDDASTFGEHAAEFVGGIAPIAAISAVASPFVGAGLRAAGVSAKAIPLTSRLGTAVVTGGVSGGLSDVARTGETSVGSIATESAIGGAQEGLFLGAGKLIKAMRGAKVKTSSPTANAIDETLERARPNVIVGKTLTQEELPLGSTEAQQLKIPFGQPKPRTKAMDEWDRLHAPKPVEPKLKTEASKQWDELQAKLHPQATPKDPTQSEMALGDQPTLFEMQRRQNIEQTHGKFHVGTDTETGKTEFISKDTVTDQAIKASSMPVPSPNSLHHVADDLGITAGDAAKASQINKLDLNAKVEAVKTDNVLKQSDEVVDKLVKEGTPPKLLDMVSIETPTNELVRLMKKSGIPDKEITQIMNDATQWQVTRKAGEIKNRKEYILQELKKRCG